MLSLWQLELHWTEAAYVTPQDMSQHAQTCFNPLIVFFPASVDKLLNTLHIFSYKETGYVL